MSGCTHLSALALLMSLSATAAPGFAHEMKSGGLRIIHPYTFGPINPSAPNAEVFMTIRNDGRPDRLIGVSMPIAETVRLQRQVPGTAKAVRPVSSFEIPSRRTVTLGPRGVHILLVNLKAPLVSYAYYPMTMIFERAGKVDVQIMVEERN